MSDPRSLLERETQRFVQQEGAFERLIDRRDRKRRNQRIRAGVLGLSIAIALGWLGINAIRSTLPVPAAPPEELPADLGIFDPVAGRIVYMAEGLWVVDDVEKGVLAVDPNGPSDTKEGPKVADDVASSLVRLDLGEDALPPAGSGDGVEPLGWSSDGTELLVTRWVGFEGAFYVVHADGTQTRVSKPSGVGARTAAISPDGSRVVFESEGLVVADIEGGSAVKLPLPAGGEPGSGPLTFSSDGTQIAYLSGDAVWVVNVDGTDAHEILAGEGPRLIDHFNVKSGLALSSRHQSVAPPARPSEANQTRRVA